VSEAAESVIQISGRLTMEITTALYGKGLPLAEGNSDLVINLAEVAAVDSSAVSLMLVWLRAARRKNVQLSFINVPDSLRSLANLYGVAESLALPVDA